MKYFTYCASGLMKSHRLSDSNNRVGFLFHDSTKEIQLADIRWPLKKLHDLIIESQQTPLTEDQLKDSARVFVTRRDANTLKACFNLVDISTPQVMQVWGRQTLIKHVVPTANPTPEDLVSKGYPAVYNDPTWFISDVTDLSSEVDFIDLGETYDSCPTLEKLMGSCPCPKSDTGECISINVFPQLSEAFVGATNTAYPVDTTRLKRSAYRQLGSFQYITPSYTGTGDYESGLKAPVDHDFKYVESRRETFKERARKALATKMLLTKECPTCEFSQVSYDDTLRHCGRPDVCRGAVTDHEVTEFLDYQYEKAYQVINRRFTSADIDRVLGAYGLELRSKGITGVKSVPIQITGFFIKDDGEAILRIAALRGDRSRIKDYASMDSFYADLPKVYKKIFKTHQPKNETTRARRLKVLLAYRHREHVHYKGSQPVVAIESNSYYVTVETANTSNVEVASDYCVTHSDVSWVNRLSNFHAVDVSQWVHSEGKVWADLEDVS